MPDQPAELRSWRVLTQLGVPEDQRISETEMNEIAGRLRGILSR